MEAERSFTQQSHLKDPEKLAELESCSIEGEKAELRRSLKGRHLSMISIGGTIGTGLFLASGASIATGGPGGALLGYGLIGIMVFFLMTSLGEMATYMPISGSFNAYGARFVDPAFGFALSWNYWYSWALTVAVELSAGGLIMQYWLPHVPNWVWSACLLVIIVGINSISVKGYGEAEYWFALIKVVTVVIFIIIGIFVATGVLGGVKYGTRNFTLGDAPFVDGALGTLGVFLVAGFSFMGTELVGVAAGESENPEKNVPTAIKQVFWRILLFYIGAIMIISFLIPYTDPNLVSSGSVQDVAISPFTLVFKLAGLGPASDVMNAIILITVLSAGNSALYACTRTLWMMANSNMAPKIFGRVNSRGVPMHALILTAVVGCLAFLTSLFGNGVIYMWLLRASSTSGFIAWIGIAVSHYRFRKAFLAQGHSLDELPYRARLYPFGPILAFVLCAVVLGGQGYEAYTNGHFDWGVCIGGYLAIIIFAVLYFGYKIINKTKIVKLTECDLSRF
ncbi:lysine-specific permease [Basidiobolus meristosporus CBS 931.73]|uniref:Lysine-specific permease n=1 Tax=Basidiobolus meristosporus CBS 931.73 TaxID=1314790 RepID=A0A1Y1YKR3_9FUNG|nr:lysine-specific permease [Basidiobolus meristosporus CBS 931.73]|eukprot:ORX98579.1 lysine-specific permease [Basidiobolus meristosporus CBS 931.73]